MTDPQQVAAYRLGAVDRLIALSYATTDDHHLLELRLHRAENTKVCEVARQPADQLGIEDVARDDEHQHAVVLQQW